MIENVKKGMTVYCFKDIWEFMEEGVVQDPEIKNVVIGSATSNPYNIPVISKINWKYYVGSDGERTREDYGTSGAKLENCFLTAKEAWEEKDRRIEEHKENLRKEITDVESLLKFPLNHEVRCGEYCDWYARAIYEEYIEKYKKGELK